VTLSNPEKPDGPTPEEQASMVELQGILHVHSERLLTYLKKRMPEDLRRFVEPQDILQDTFFEAFTRSREFQARGKDSAHRWLVTIARHRMFAILRMQQTLKRGGPRPEENEFDAVCGFLDGLAVYTRTPSQSAMSHEIASAVQQSMNFLEPQYRRVIQLRFIEGLSVQKTADVMGRSRGAILMLCNRALKSLKLLLQSVSVPV
jgi:RNA polymerase sigma-70 factor (ECF subfamily)